MIIHNATIRYHFLEFVFLKVESPTQAIISYKLEGIELKIFFFCKIRDRYSITLLTCSDWVTLVGDQSQPLIVYTQY